MLQIPHTPLSHTLIPSSIGGRVGELSPGETDTAIASVENRVKPLQEGHAKDKVQTRVRLCNVNYDQVNGVLFAKYGGVERARPDLSVPSHFKCLAANDYVERLEALVLRLGNAEQLSGVIKYPTSYFDVLIVCV